MSLDVATITREMLRKAFADATSRSSFAHVLSALESNLFGHRKPREWSVYIDENYIHSHKGRAGMEQIRVREVLDEP